MITPSFGLTATERVLPKLALDFTTASLDSRVTFTRTTDSTHPATYVNSSGTVTAATNNEPRFDYDPVTLLCKGLLIEESRANILTYSSDFSTSWALSGATINSTATTAPDGTLTATKLIENNGTSTHQVQRTNVFVADGVTRSWSLYVKQGERRYIAFSNGTLFSNSSNTLIFDTQVGAWTYGTPATGAFLTTQNAGNGWWRIAFNSASTSASYDNVLIGLCNGPSDYTAATYAGDGSSGIYIWGAQLEAGAFATSYIPTTTTALTRNADVAVMTGTNFSGWFNASEGTFACEYQVAQYNAALAQMVLSSGSAAAVETYMACSTSNVNQFTVQNTTNQANFASLGSVTLHTPAKICGFYKANYFSAAGNGTTTGGVDTSGTLPTMNKLVFGARNDGARPLNGHVRTVEYWPFTLTTNEILAYSKP